MQNTVPRKEGRRGGWTSSFLSVSYALEQETRRAIVLERESKKGKPMMQPLTEDDEDDFLRYDLNARYNELRTLTEEPEKFSQGKFETVYTLDPCLFFPRQLYIEAINCMRPLLPSAIKGLDGPPLKKVRINKISTRRMWTAPDCKLVLAVKDDKETPTPFSNQCLGPEKVTDKTQSMCCMMFLTDADARETAPLGNSGEDASKRKTPKGVNEHDLDIARVVYDPSLYQRLTHQRLVSALNRRCAGARSRSASTVRQTLSACSRNPSRMSSATTRPSSATILSSSTRPSKARSPQNTRPRTSGSFRDRDFDDFASPFQPSHKKATNIRFVTSARQRPQTASPSLRRPTVTPTSSRLQHCRPAPDDGAGLGIGVLVRDETRVRPMTAVDRCKPPASTDDSPGHEPEARTPIRPWTAHDRLGAQSSARDGIGAQRDRTHSGLLTNAELDQSARSDLRGLLNLLHLGETHGPRGGREVEVVDRTWMGEGTVSWMGQVTGSGKTRARPWTAKDRSSRVGSDAGFGW